MNRYFLILLFMLLASAKNLKGQSFNAYISAGDECMAKKDPFCAISMYRQALELDENPRGFLSMGKAEKALYNYESSVNWFSKCIAASTPDEIKIEALENLADLYKRTGAFASAISCLDSLKYVNSEKTRHYDSLKVAYSRAAEICRDSLPLQMNIETGDVNSSWSDFAPAVSGDSLLFFSSLRYKTKKGDEELSTSRIALARLTDRLKPASSLLPETVNQASFNNANASISPDGRLMVFTRCLYNEKNELICSLYESKFENGRWQQAVKLVNDINHAGSTSTQPCISTYKGAGYILLFSSNKPGGAGGMDIWISRRDAKGTYSKPENAGKTINTERDEWTPFLDILQDTLFFSSERPEGPGGLDLYSLPFENRAKEKAQPLPPPLNSGYNDLYYTRSYGRHPLFFLVSNRPPAAKLNASSCCYDIFRIDSLEEPIPVASMDSLSIAGKEHPDTAYKNMSAEQQIAIIEERFPIRLYFDNDRPDPRSKSPTTKSSYDDLVTDYMNREAEYLRQQTTTAQKDNMGVFFSDSVRINYEKLLSFTSKMYLTLISNNVRLKLSILGSASPLADNAYNLTLSARRIASLLNFWRSWQGGLLAQALEQGRLEIEFIPAGEERASREVSDRRDDQVNSVFSREAALERRIELSDIEIIK